MTTQISGDTGVSAVQDGAVKPETDIAYNQTWQDVTTSRVLGSVYTNNTGQPIDIFVTLSSSVTAAAAAVVNGVTIGYTTSAIAGTILGIAFKVPAGATYTAGASAGVPTLSSWFELRAA